jgi:hypothetical protein
MKNTITARIKKIIIGISILILSSTICVFLIIPIEDRSIVNGFTVFGTSLSFVGILIAYMQISSVKDINAQIKKDVDNSILKIKSVLSASDLEKAVSFISYIIDKINHEEYELAHLRMCDLEGILIEIKDKKTPKNYMAKEYEDHLSNLRGDLISMGRFIHHRKKEIDFNKIHENLTNTATTIKYIITALKNNQIWTNR